MPNSPRNAHAVVFDFDGTLTPRQTGALPNVVDAGVLQPAGSRHLSGLRERFNSLSLLGQLSHADEVFWLKETFRAYADHGLTRPGWQTALESVSLREGVAETLAWLEAEGIPTAVVSFGCADFIEHVLDRHKVRVAAVYAARLKHEGERAVGGDHATFVLPLHKGERSRHFADLHGVPHENLIAVGDSGGDRFLGHLKEHRIGISETEAEAERLRQLEVMGEIHVTSTFHPILAAIKRRLGLD